MIIILKNVIIFFAILIGYILQGGCSDFCKSNFVALFRQDSNQDVTSTVKIKKTEGYDISKKYTKLPRLELEIGEFLNTQDYYGDIYYYDKNGQKELIAKTKTVANGLASTSFKSELFFGFQVSPSKKWALLEADCWEMSCLFMYNIENKKTVRLDVYDSYSDSKWMSDNILEIWGSCGPPFKLCNKYISVNSEKPWDLKKIDISFKKEENVKNTTSTMYSWNGDLLNSSPWIKYSCKKEILKDKRNINDVVLLLQDQFSKTNAEKKEYSSVAEFRLKEVKSNVAYLEIGSNNFGSSAAEIFMGISTLALTQLDEISYVNFNFYVIGSHGYGLSKNYSGNDYKEYVDCDRLKY